MPRDKAVTLAEQKQMDEALVAIDRACALGEYWEFLLQRAKLELSLKKTAEARRDVERAAALRPGATEIMIFRVRVNVVEKKWEAAGNELVDVLRIEPTDPDARDLFRSVVDWLVYEGSEHSKAGRREDAIRVFDLAAELAPNDRRIDGARAWTILGKAATPEAIPPLEEEVKRNPDAFSAHLQLDYALAKQGQHERIVEMWTAYLARHPDDGRAYLERGGAYFNSKKRAEALADAKRACDLGVTKGCAMAGVVGR